MNGSARKVFLSGATGAIGRRVVPLLLADGHQVSAVARTDAKAAELAELGAEPSRIDLFSKPQVLDAVAGHDAVLHLATNIPVGPRAAMRSGWRTNDRLRTEAAANLASAAIETGAARYIGESITFPYVDSGDAWIDESTSRAYFWGNQSTVYAEAAAQSVEADGGVGVALRFAMFHALDGPHIQLFRNVASKGFSPMTGDPEGFVSFIDVGDAAAAVIASLDVASGIYNVAEAEPKRRADHAAVLAKISGQTRLRTTPAFAQRMGGKGVESLSRSQRVACTKFRDASLWQPMVDPISRWGREARSHDG